jgi:hypothetical protein
MVSPLGYVVIAIVILAVAYGAFYFLKPSKAPVKTPVNSSIKRVPTNISAPPPLNLSNSSYVNATKTNSTENLTHCISNKSSVLIYNGNFSLGYYTWVVTGTGFGNKPLNLTAANDNGIYYQHPWSGYNGQFAATTWRQAAALLPGNISTNFVVVKPYLNFQIISANNSQLYVEVLYQGNPVIVKRYNTPNGQGIGQLSTFASASINMTTLLCKSVMLRVVANITEPTSNPQNKFIAVGNFYQSGSSYQTSGIAVNAT